MNKGDLDSATIDDLVAAIRAKVPCFVMCACIPDDGGESYTQFYGKGNLMTMRGLAATAQDKVRQLIKQNTTT